MTNPHVKWMCAGSARFAAITGPLFLFVFAAACGTAGSRLVTSDGRAIPELEYLWEEVDSAFPGALPSSVTLVLVQGPHASFMIENNSIGIPSSLPSQGRKGRISRELTHLALHALSGGGEKNPGRCFDGDVVFLEQALAGYMDWRASGRDQAELAEAEKLAERLFNEGSLSVHKLRDWESFYWRGFESDQYQEWNLEGLAALLSLGEHLVRTYEMERVRRVFELLADDPSLDGALRTALGVDTETLLECWREEVMAADAPFETPAGGEDDDLPPATAGTK